jgi:hypothetical protein
MKTLISTIVLCISLLAVVTGSDRVNVTRAQEPTAQNGATLPIKVTIQTAKNALNSITDRFRAGDQILVPITMTNTSTNPVAVCDSSDIYQDMPTLKKNGTIVPIMNWQSRVERILEHDETCERLNVPDHINLNPNDPIVVDWLVLVDSKVSTGSDAWYDSLPPGKYELTLQRRLACCVGPTVQSNKISFEVMP